MSTNIAFRDLPHGHGFEHIKAVSVPMVLPTAIGNWIHLAVVETDHVPDPTRPISPAAFMNSVKEHSLLIYAGDKATGDLDSVPLDQLVPPSDQPVLARIHSLCRFGDSLHGTNCDCGPQLFAAMMQMREEGAGVIFYMEQEGRNAGLAFKTAANADEQVNGTSTADTFDRLGLPKNDLRRYDVVGEMAQLVGVSSVKLLTNNPAKIEGISRTGIHVERAAHHIPDTDHSRDYLGEKRARMGHMVDDDLRNGQYTGHARTIMGLREVLADLLPEDIASLQERIRVRRQQAAAHKCTAC